MYSAAQFELVTEAHVQGLAALMHVEILLPGYVAF